MQHALKQPKLTHQAIEAWEKVVRWKGLSAANKLAWMYLYTKSHFGRQLIDVTTTEIGEAQGVSGSAVDKRFATLVGAVAFRQMLDTPALVGIGFIVAGVVIINVFSNTSHVGGA